MAGETPWTPGPWEVGDGGITGPDWQLVVMPRDGHVYSEYTSDPATLEIKNPADARLIACAPEMAEALREVDEMFSRPGTINKDTVRDHVRALLSKLTGEA